MSQTSEKSSGTTELSVAMLRSAFARCCKVLGLDQKTCLELTLLLNSRAELAVMLMLMLEAEDRGEKWGTTEVCLAAERIKEESAKMGSLSGRQKGEES